MSIQKEINYINLLGQNKEPFLFIIDFNKTQCIVKKLSEVNTNDILFSINGLSNTNSVDEISNKKVFFTKNPIAFEAYKKGFSIVHSNLKKGNSYLSNFTCETQIASNLSLLEIFNKSTAKYKLYYKNKFVVFSPETFIKIKDGKIFSFPMKGTIDAAIKNAEDLILRDAKEMAEHATITDLIRNDLSKIATNVKVDNYRYLDKIKTNTGELLQVSSQISGDLPKNHLSQLGDILNSLLPAGSISGAPKQKTIEIITEAENYDRGFYTGVFGVFDGENLDCGVMIRFIENKNGNMVFKSGGGITINSAAQKEYEEMISKVYLPFI